MKGGTVDILLGLLACPKTEYWSNLLSPYGMDVGCTGRINELCKAIKQQPVSVALLCRDILVQNTQWSSLDDVALVLESVEKAGALLEDEDSALLLRALAQAVDSLEQGLLKDSLEDDVDKRQKVTRHARRIAGFLHAASIS